MTSAPDSIALLGLVAVLAGALVLPFLHRRIEENLEAFVLAMGILAVSAGGSWTQLLIGHALKQPVPITLAVLAAGFLFEQGRIYLRHRARAWSRKLGVPRFSFLTILLLGLLSSAVTAIIAALLLAEIVSGLTLDRRTEIRLVILSCYAIGLGAALTPIGEPLSTLVVSKLSGAPYQAGFFFLLKHLGVPLLAGISVLSLGGLALKAEPSGRSHGLTEDRPETGKDILRRAANVYVFVAGLVFLGEGFRPLMDAYFLRIPAAGMYWINSVSAVLDNATLAAAEVSPKMPLESVRFLLMGLLIAGGILIPGNIPNIIAAGKLRIKSREWAAFAAPVGIVLMAAFFMALQLGF